MSATHEMVLAGYTESGAEEWHCPVCGRRTVLRWPPEYERVVLERGDDSVAHVGGKGGLRMAGAYVPRWSSPAVAEDDRQWLREIGIDWENDPV